MREPQPRGPLDPYDYVSPPMERVGTLACIDPTELSRLRQDSERLAAIMSTTGNEAAKAQLLASVDAAIEKWKNNSERWVRTKRCAVDEGDGVFTICPETAFIDRDFDPDAEAFEQTVDAAIAAEKGME